MEKLIERSQIDLRYQSFRVRKPQQEKRLLSSIEHNGIQLPLSVVPGSDDNTVVLLDGFKRYRCCVKLGIDQLPISIVGDSEVEGFLRLIRHNTATSLTGFEEACFIEQLHTVYKLDISEIARRVDRSVTWVRLRIDMLKNMSDTIRSKIVSGAFPLRSYLYDLRPVTRVRGSKGQLEEFVEAVSGRDYSTRDISTLSRAYFSGDETVRKQLSEGNVDWTLRMLKDKDTTANNEENSQQQRFLKHLHGCLWHFTRLLPMFQNDHQSSWMQHPSIRDPLDRLYGRCRSLLNT